MALQKITEEQIKKNQIASLPDRMTGTAAENKAAFDALVKVAIDAFNALVDTLAATGGAGEIGAAPFTGVGDAATVQEQLRTLQENINNVSLGAIPDGSITTAKLGDTVVSTAKLMNACITAAKLAADAVITEKIADGAVKTEKLADESVTSAKLADGSITGGKLPDGGIAASKLADGAVTNAKLADGAVTLAKITGGKIPDSWLSSTPLKLKTGSYTGNNTWQSTNNKITVGFAAKFFFVCENAQAANYIIGVNPGTYCAIKTTKSVFVKATWGSTAVEWNSFSGDDSTNADYQCNRSDRTYYWVAIG